MSEFTTQLPPRPRILITLEETMPGQVDILAHASNGDQWRIAAIGDGKLRLFQLHHHASVTLGIQLDVNGYPVVTQCQ